MVWGDARVTKELANRCCQDTEILRDCLFAKLAEPGDFEDGRRCGARLPLVHRVILGRWHDSGTRCTGHP